MLTWLLIFALPGAIVFGGLGWFWRYRLRKPSPHFLLALGVSFIAWFSSMVFGWFLYLEVLSAGLLGPALNPGFLWSFIPAYLTYFVLRRKIEPPISTNNMNYFGK